MASSKNLLLAVNELLACDWLSELVANAGRQCLKALQDQGFEVEDDGINGGLSDVQRHWATDQQTLRVTGFVTDSLSQTYYGVSAYLTVQLQASQAGVAKLKLCGNCADGKVSMQFPTVVVFETPVDKKLLKGEDFRNAVCAHVQAAVPDAAALEASANKLALSLTAALSQ